MPPPIHFNDFGGSVHLSDFGRSELPLQELSLPSIGVITSVDRFISQISVDPGVTASGAEGEVCGEEPQGGSSFSSPTPIHPGQCTLLFPF